jgi:hypothetical protein
VRTRRRERLTVIVVIPRVRLQRVHRRVLTLLRLWTPYFESRRRSRRRRHRVIVIVVALERCFIVIIARITLRRRLVVVL